MDWQLELNGHRVSEVLAATRAATQPFGWQPENSSPYEKLTEHAATSSEVVAVFNLKCAGEHHRVTVMLQGDGKNRRCHLTREKRHTSHGAFYTQDDELDAHYDALHLALVAALR